MTKTAELSSALRLSVMRLSRRLRQERAELSLSLNQLATLATLERTGPLSPHEIADHERVQPPSMTRILAALEERQLVARTAHPTDRRQQLLSVTDAARDMLREDRRRRDAWLARRIAELPPEERSILHRAAPILARLATM